MNELDSYVAILSILVLISFVPVCVIASWLHALRLRRLVADRTDDSICRFVRSMDYRRLDLKVIRAVYESLQDYFLFVCIDFPIRPSDDFDRDYRMNRDDLDILAALIAGDCGRSLKDHKKNPYVPISTVADLIEFLCTLPPCVSTAKMASHASLGSDEGAGRENGTGPILAR